MNRRQALHAMAGTVLSATGLPLVASEVVAQAELLKQLKTPVINPDLWKAMKRIEGWYDQQTGLTDVLKGRR